MPTHQRAQPYAAPELDSLQTKRQLFCGAKTLRHFTFHKKLRHLRDCGTPAQVQMLVTFRFH